MGRRGENIRKRGDGRWEARVVCGPPVEGRTNYKYLYSRTYQGVRALKKEFISGLDLLSGQRYPVSMSDHLPDSQGSPTDVTPKEEETPALFHAVAAAWLADKKLSVKESTIAAYTFTVEKHLLPVFGDIPVNNLDTEQIGTFLMDIKSHGNLRDGKPLSNRTVGEIKGTLNRIFRYAKNHNMIDTVPNSLPVSMKQTPVELLTKQEQEAIVVHAVDEAAPFNQGIILALYTGIRIGELCALQWKDINWEEGIVSVSQTVSRISYVGSASGPKTHVVVGAPKTACSIRQVPIPCVVLKHLKDYVGKTDAYILTGSSKLMEPRVCRERFARFLKKAGIKHHKFHSLRHTYATECVEQGIDLKTLSENLGHADVKITLQRYVHPSMESKKAQVNKLTTFIGSNQE